MKTISYQRHRFHSDIINQSIKQAIKQSSNQAIKLSIWLYFRFTMSYRDVEELLAERGIEVSYETVRRWVDTFRKLYAKRIKERRTHVSVAGR